MPENARFVFSFRSPYAWIAARWVLPQLPAELELDWTPFFPLESFENFNGNLDSKMQYLVRDVIRLVKHHGGQVTFPSAEGPNWAVPHCAFLEAREQGRGREFALAVFEARFGRGENVAEEEVLIRAAEEVDLDPVSILAAGFDTGGQAMLTEQIQREFDEQGIFGVPTLIMPRGTRYWGHDRIEWGIREGKIPG
jgi:2-hydroxychromene-2-carboxylate isomerase